MKRCELAGRVAIGQSLRREGGGEEDKKDSEIGFEECQESVEGFRVVESTEQDANKEG